jgi:anaerobic selenocysteine-containing dehydrogenase
LAVRGNWEKGRVGILERLGEIERRRFIKLSGMSAAALVVGAGPFTEKATSTPRLSSRTETPRRSRSAATGCPRRSGPAAPKPR